MFIGVIVGALLTAVLQSSSATTGILIALATAGAIDIKLLFQYYLDVILVHA